MQTTDAPKHITLEEAVDRYARQATEPFDTDDILDEVVSKLRRAPSEPWRAVDEALTASEWLFLDDETQRYIPRATFFRGARFLMAPLADEIRDGILVPGHRFIPFLARDAHPWMCTLRTGDGTTIPRKRIERTFTEVGVYFSFYGPQGTLEQLMQDDPEGVAALIQETETNPPLTLTVFDMGAFYQQYAVAPGDAICCTVENWVEGVYTIRHIPAAELEALKAHRKLWIEEFENALDDAGRHNRGAFTDVYHQLAEAFFRGIPQLRDEPPIHLGGFLAASDFRIHPLPTGIILERRHVDTEDLLLNIALKANLRESTGRCESLEAILADLNLPTAASRIDACMQDAIFHGDNSMDQAVARALEQQDIDFHDRRQAEAYNEYIHEHWNHFAACRDPAREQLIGPLRARVLALLEQHSRWMADCDEHNVFLDEQPPERVSELAHYQRALEADLALLNRAETPTPEDLRHLAAALDDMEQRTNQLRATMREEYALESTHSVLRLLDDEEEDDEPEQVYQIRVDLKGIRPPIWRRLLISSYTALDELHDILQGAMGWTHSHLHEFTIDGERYSADGELFDFDGPEDEEGILLCHVVDGEGDRFSYTYDFGDGWEHTIRIEKVLPTDDGATYPRCIKGKRACPPEDCGGPWGYRHLLEAISDPTHENHDDLAAWLGDDFDPEAFDIEVVNTRLRRT